LGRIDSNNGLIIYGNDYDYLNRSHKTQTKWIAGSQIAHGHCINTPQRGCGERQSDRDKVVLERDNAVN